MINSKKAQSQLITTVLIILLVLAAVIIVWQLTQRTLSGGAEQVDRSANCMGVGVEIVSVNRIPDNKLRVVLKRTADSLDSARIDIDIVDSSGVNSAGLQNSLISPGQTISVVRNMGHTVPEGEITISSRLLFDDGLVCDGGIAKKTI